MLSKSPVLRRDRGIYTYYHHAHNLGLAQQHILNIADKVAGATREAPHQLVFRINAAPGANRETMREVVRAHKDMFNQGGFSSHSRTFENSDGSIDGEVRVDVATGDKSFREAVLTLGDIAHIPGSI